MTILAVQEFPAKGCEVSTVKIAELLREAAARLPGEDARHEAEQLLLHTLGVERAWLFAHATDEVAEAFVAKFPTTKFFAVKPELDAPELDAPELDAPELDAPELENLEGMTAEESKKEKKRKADAARRERERAAKLATQTDLT